MSVIAQCFWLCFPWNYSMDDIKYIPFFLIVVYCICVKCFLSFWGISSSFFNNMADKLNTPRTWLWPCINSSHAAPFVSHVQQKCTESLFCVWVCVRICKSWLTGCVCVSSSARDADEREKWIQALEGTILRHTLQFRVWNSTFLSICVC